MSIISSIYIKLRLVFARKDEKGEYSSGYLPSMVRDKFLSLCKNKTGKILEIGCGEGLFLAKLRQANPDLNILAIDILREGLERARNREALRQDKKVGLFQADAREICFQDNVFDCVVCLNTLFNMPSFEHVKLAIKEAIRVAKKDAEVIVDIRNKDDLLTSIRYKFVKLYDSKCAVGLKQYHPQEIMDIFKDNNAYILEVKPMKAFFNLSTPITIIRAKKR